MVRYPDWTKEEIKLIKELGPKITLIELAEKFPSKTVSQVKTMRIKTIGNKQDKTKWTKEEDAIILKYGKEKSVNELISLLPTKRSFYKVSDRRLKLIGNVRDEYAEWSKKEDKVLFDNKNLKLAEYEKLLNFKFNKLQIQRRKKSLNLTNRRTVWSKEEINLLEKNKKKSLSELSKIIKTKSEIQIQNAKVKYGIRKKEPWSEKEKKDLTKLSKKYDLSELYQFFPNRGRPGLKTVYYDLGLRNPIRNNWPKQFKRLYKEKNNNGKPITDYEFRYSKYEINLECEFGHVFPRGISNLYGRYKRDNNYIPECAKCRNKVVYEGNSLVSRFPNIASHFSKKNKDDVNQILITSLKRYIWECDNGHEFKLGVRPLTHEWLGEREDGSTYNYKIREKDEFVCEECGKEPLITEDKRFSPYIHPTKNDPKQIEKTRINRTRYLVWWKCPKGDSHVWQQQPWNIRRNFIRDPNYKLPQSCHVCLNQVVTKETTLKNKRPDIFKLVDKDYHNLKEVGEYYYRSSKIELNFKCLKNPEHKWSTNLRLINDLAGDPCPLCRKRWDKKYLKIFLESTIKHLHSMSQSERWVFFQKSGILDSTERNIAFAKQVITQKFPIKEIEKFVNDEPSLVDDILDDPTITSEDYLDPKSNVEIESEIEETIQNFDGVIEQEKEILPEIKSKDVLKSLDQITSSQFCDKEAIEFLIVSKKEKLWRDVFQRGDNAVNEIKKATGNEYVKRAQSEFLFEYNHTSKLTTPKNFTAKKPNGELIIPNLMQYLTSTRLNYNLRIGNWSGTGAGKTLSAILASRLLDLRFTIVTCPNSVVSNWQDNIRDAFKDSEILDKNNLPEKINAKKHNYLVLNYEYFQQPTSSSYVKKLLTLGKISFIVIDEVHYTKQREIENVSKRKEMIKNLVVEAGKKNKNLKVIGMSATPVINNLFEGRSMIELITGKEHKDIDTSVNVNNCMYLFQKLSTIGTRYLPQYQVGIKEEIHYVDCSDVVEEIRDKGANQISVLALELILTRKRIPEIIKHLEKKTVIYTHYIKGIGELLADAITNEGYKVGFYTGDNKTNREKDFEGFLKGDIDVLIGTSAIGTGVDGLQHVCRKLIFNVLPWTNAEYEQIKGRIFRQLQKQDVEFILPLTKAEVNGQEWSWCKTKLDRIHYKKTVADAAVDGVIPEEHIRSEHQVLQDLMKWLERLSDKGLETIERKELASTLFTDDDKELKRRKIKHGDFTKLNTRWNNSRSGITHKRLQKDNREWAHYHEEYRKARKDWVMTPYKEMIKFYKKRDGLVIGDFGCGEGFIYKDLSSKHKVHSFDHVAAEEFVTECDFSKTPLDDETLDVAIYSLSMMGSNINEYLNEAHRVLRLDGKINIIEATKRFKDIEQFKLQLQEFGFDNVVSKGMWKFTHIVAEKSDRKVNEKAKISF